MNRQSFLNTLALEIEFANLRLNGTEHWSSMLYALEAPFPTQTRPELLLKSYVTAKHLMRLLM